MGVNPFAVAALPSSYRFSNGFLYQFKIDTNGDYHEDYADSGNVQDDASHAAAGAQTFHVRVGKVDVPGAVNALMTNQDIDVTGAVSTVVNSKNVSVFAGLRDDPFTFDLGQFNRIQAGTSQLFRAVPASPIGPLSGRAW